VLALLGLVLFESGRAPEAVPILEAAVDLAPTSALAHFGLGRVLQVTGREAEVAPHLAALERLEPRLAERLKRRWYRQSGAAHR
jgi:tetratricopeptide (TPR) repeat protein